MNAHEPNDPSSAWAHPLTPEERAQSTGEAAETWNAFAQLCGAATPQLDEVRLLAAVRQRLGAEQPPATRAAKSTAAGQAPVWPVPIWAAAALALAATLILAAAIAFWPHSDEQTAQPPLPAPESVSPEQAVITPPDVPAPETAPATEVRDAYASDANPALPDEAVASEWEWEDAAWDEDLDAMEQSLSTFRTTWAQGASASATLSEELESFAAELEAGAL